MQPSDTLVNEAHCEVAFVMSLCFVSHKMSYLKFNYKNVNY